MTDAHSMSPEELLAETRWLRTLANMGLPPVGQMSRPADQPTVADGVVYITDSLGVTAAVEATSGRFVVWHLDYARNRTNGLFTTPDSPTAPATDWTIVGPR